MDDQLARSRNPTDLPLSADVIRLITVANDESTRRDHEYIGTEHLVLAMTEPSNSAASLLALSVEPERVHTLIDDTIRRGNRALPADLERPFTSRTKDAFSLAAAAAHELGHSHIGVPHLLGGLMREQKNIGAQVLADSGLTAERAFELAKDTGAAS
jgi:ATP-dependent Clp protease ATP-binding subunit ClpC